MSVFNNPSMAGGVTVWAGQLHEHGMLESFSHHNSTIQDVFIFSPLTEKKVWAPLLYIKNALIFIDLAIVYSYQW